MKAITNTIANHKEVITIAIFVLAFVGLVIYNILTIGIQSI